MRGLRIMEIKTRRKTFNDYEISKETYNLILSKVFDKFTKEELELSQQNIIKTLLPLKLSNNMIAKVIKDILPDTNPTAGSVASQIRIMNRKGNQEQELISLIEKEL